MDIASRFDYATREREIYAAWEARGAFIANRDSQKPPFVISMPPPNANGPLHLGHALMLSIEDVMIRWRRMSGDEVLWLPGTDHASIATESHVIRRLQKRGIADPRRDLKRDGLVREIANYVDDSRRVIREQIRRLGSSCDWSRERYTLDPDVSRIVNETFGKMFHDGLIYRGNRIVHWDVRLQTTLSDDEVRPEERKGTLYTIQCSQFQITTDTPELCLAYTALAIHPRDMRKMWHEWVGKLWDTIWPQGPTVRLRMIEDSAVDPNFGTGVVGIAPAHDMKDFEIGKRHGLPFLSILNEDGKMTDAAGPYKGMTRMQCRAAFVKDLREANLLIAEIPHSETVQISERGGAPVEHLLKEQWFIDVNRPVIPWGGAGNKMSLRQVMAEVVNSGQITFIPKQQEKRYFHWVDELQDWCISRQIWWGHRVPVWYRRKSETYVGSRPMEAEGWRQDPDTLDTWFSSALWTWSTLVDKAATEDFELGLEEILERSPDYQHFHPTTVLETGSDVLLFWVARMILATTYATGRIPFQKVYVHGLLQDKEGQKMSLSKPELCIDPETLIAEHGADTLRLALIGPNSTGIDMQLTPERLKGAKRFVDKVWNAARYVAMLASFEGRPEVTHPVNRWMLRKLDVIVEDTTSSLTRSILGESAQSLRDAFRSDFCDLYIEATKTESFRDLEETRQFLGYALETYLRLLHPFIPFVTEELWSQTGHEGFLMQETWPEPHAPQAEHEKTIAGVEELIVLIMAIRNWRAEHKLNWRVRVEVEVWSGDYRDLIELCGPILLKLVDGTNVRFVDADGTFNLEISGRLKAAVRIVEGEEVTQ